jgi:hypothetical protein
MDAVPGRPDRRTPDQDKRSFYRRITFVVIGVLVIAAVVGTIANQHTPSGDAAAVTHACALVRYWNDPSGSVPDPDTGFTSEKDVTDLAQAAWPGDIETGGAFVQLYLNLSKDWTDAQYALLANQFLAANCP